MCEYAKKVDEMCWSYSRLTSYERCKYEFYLNYIINDDSQYLSESNFYAEVGIFVHEILAKIFNGELTPDEASQYFVDNFDSNVFYKAKQSTMDKNFELCANYFASVDFGWLNDYEILGVELETKFKIDKYDFIGFIDLLLRDKRDGKIVIVDNKSSEYPFKQNGDVKAKSKHSFETYKKQMYLYSYAVKDMYGEFPKEITWNHFKDNKIAAIPFDTIHSIEKENDFDATLDFFYCTNLCNFRNSCEYAKTATWR